MLDVIATADERGDGLTVSVVNRSPTDAVEADLRFADAIEPPAATVERVIGPDPQAVNSFEDPNRVAVETEQLESLRDGTVLRFPAHSHTVITCGEEATP